MILFEEGEFYCALYVFKTTLGGAVEENVEAMRLAAECACTGAQAIKRVHVHKKRFIGYIRLRNKNFNT